jgi:hypothetical protein
MQSRVNMISRRDTPMSSLVVCGGFAFAAGKDLASAAPPA